MDKFAIIVAGGSGTRFGSTLPKQFMLLAGQPVLMHAIRAFSDAAPDAGIIVALPSEHIALWHDLCTRHGLTTPHTVVAGGTTRFESVRNALRAIPTRDGLVAIHDGARPLVSRRMISDGFDMARQCGTAIPVVPVTDSLRCLDHEGSHSVDRSNYVAVQTPQVFSLALLKDAYMVSYSPTFTDDASVVEFHGTPVTLYKGDPTNLKITHPADLDIAQLILDNAGH